MIQNNALERTELTTEKFTDVQQPLRETSGRTSAEAPSRGVAGRGGRRQKPHQAARAH
jgi:hypothetical protein